MPKFTVSYQRDTSPAADIGQPPAAMRGVLADGPGENPRFHNDEAAARFHLSRHLGRDERPVLRGLAAPGDPRLVPDLHTIGTEDSPLTDTRLVSFNQTRAAIPIFGTRLVVELDQERQLVGVNGELSDPPNVSPIATLSPADALKAIAMFAKLPAGETVTPAAAPQLVFFQDDDHQWHLCYSYGHLPVEPASDSAAEDTRHFCGIGALRAQHPSFTYLVDAHAGDVVFFYSTTPTAAVVIPIACSGVDEEDAPQQFFGREESGTFFLWDPWRRIKTYDYNFQDISKPGPAQPISASSSAFTGKGAVSAHVNAARVYDFYNAVLLRSSIDNKGMEIISNVNCLSAPGTPGKAKDWPNAAWWSGRMWYGQIEADGAVRSYSRYLDVIGHELTHGVTELTSGLVYREQSGALNESFSDIFGVIINNWSRGRTGSVAGWDWNIGMGLNANGPLRDLSDPHRTKDPAHMSEYVKRPVTRAGDWGGVHTNSNIHNKAAYNVLTATAADGTPHATPRDAAVLYYLCLTRLSALGTFSSALTVLLDVASTYFSGNAKRSDKVDAIRSAYAKVGIQ